ncbi:MAG TPA: hypothetical protein VN408_00920, partial [Actinoplanes sp.]|nr:hypothetical protein [Actinoplanes sp.]
SGNLALCAVAGLAFYTLLAGIIAKLIIACTAATAAIGSVIFSEIGALIFVEEGVVNTTAISAALVTLGAFLSAQAQGMISLHGEAVDPAGFPGKGAGAWPTSKTHLFNDATVADGDADWSLKDE